MRSAQHATTRPAQSDDMAEIVRQGRQFLARMQIGGTPLQHESQRIALFRALQLGDLLVAIPAIRALRSRFPRAEITLIGLPIAQAFVQRYPRYLNRFVPFPGYPGIHEKEVGYEHIQHFLIEQRDYRYDLVIQMHGSGQISNPFALDLHGSTTAGYYIENRPHGLELAEPYPRDQHEIYRNLGLAALLKSCELHPDLEFPLTDADHAEARTLLRQTRVDRPRIGIHPGASSPARRWPPGYFARVADELVEHLDAQIIITGHRSEQDIVEAVMAHIRYPVHNLAGQTSLGGLAAVISRLDLFISNDTGPAHLANALHCPSITLFGPAEYRRWAPLDQQQHIALRHPVPCSPCGYRECPIDHRCLRWLDPENVIQHAQNLLAQAGAKSQGAASHRILQKEKGL